MRKLVTLLAAFAGSLAIPAAAEASDGFVTADVNMRAGPSVSYPRITVLPQGAPIDVYGCLASYTWCDVGYYHMRGWVSSRYLSIFYDGPSYVYRPRYAVPSVTFQFDYWDRWYRGLPWYNDWRWRYRTPRHDGSGDGRVWVPDHPPRNDPPPRQGRVWVPGDAPRPNAGHRNDGPPKGGWVVNPKPQGHRNDPVPGDAPRQAKPHRLPPRQLCPVGDPNCAANGMRWGDANR